MEIKCQATGLDPFKEHAAVMRCFLVVTFVYAIALTRLTYQSSNDILCLYACHVAGPLACELLLLVLVTPLWWVVINVSSAILVVALWFFCQNAPSVLNLVRTSCFGMTAETSSIAADGED